jgi:hypothetical protein
MPAAETSLLNRCSTSQQDAPPKSRDRAALKVARIQCLAYLSHQFLAIWQLFSESQLKIK